jgi:Tfp pilus assembly protein FimV
MTYSLSQLDAIGDVDPVAEADVYLAYGRDLQAEEILKEAMRSNPSASRSAASCSRSTPSGATSRASSCSPPSSSR